MSDEGWLRELGAECECVCGHEKGEHTRLAKGWGRETVPNLWCTVCPCEEFEPNMVWRDSHGNPVDPDLIPEARPDAETGAHILQVAAILDMPPEHYLEVERLSGTGELAAFFYDEIGVLVILNEEGDEIARLI